MGRDSNAISDIPPNRSLPEGPLVLLPLNAPTNGCATLLTSTTFLELDADALSDLRDAAQHGQLRLGIQPSRNLASHDVLQALDEYLVAACAASVADINHAASVEELAFQCGAVWGNELVAALGWNWGRVKFAESSTEAVGVASRDASLVIYPFQTIFFYYERVLPVRVLRSFEVLSEPGRVPMLPPGGLENVMDHIP